MVEERGSARSRTARYRRALTLSFIVLLAALLLSGLSAGLPGAQPSAQAAKSRGELLDQLDSTKSKLAKTREAIRAAEATRKTALEEMAVLDQKIDALERDLGRVERQRDEVAGALAGTRSELDTVKGNLDKKRAELAKAQEDLKVQQSRLNERATSIYKGQELGYIDVLLSTNRLLDLVNRLELLAMLMQQDEQVLGQIKILRAKVTSEKIALQKEEARLHEMEARQAEQTRKLNGLVAEREDKIGRLDNARDAKKAVAIKAEQDKALWEKQETQLQRDSAGIEAELRKLGSSGGSGAKITKGSGHFIWPVNGRLSSRFGYRVHPIFKVRKMHTGIDIGAGMGTPIKAAGAGTVVFAGWRGGYGKTIIISHGGGLATLYAHQSVLLVGSGQSVGRGQVIGKVGSTGYSTGPHLHFEVRKSGSPVNPLSYL